MDCVDGVTSSFFGKRKRMPLIPFPSGRRTICTALGLILCFDLVRRRKLFARSVASSSFVKKLISRPTNQQLESFGWRRQELVGVTLRDPFLQDFAADPCLAYG